MKKLILALSFISIFTLSSCTVTKTIIEIPEENSNNESIVANNEDYILPSNPLESYDDKIYINGKTDGTIFYFLPDITNDNFAIITEKVDDIYEVSLKDILRKEIEINPYLSEDIIINSISVEKNRYNNIAYIDVNSNFINELSDPNYEIYSLVNVLFYNKALEIDRVKFLIDGEEVDTILNFDNKLGFIGYKVIDSFPAKFDPNIIDEKITPINQKTDGTVYFFKHNSNADGFDVIEDTLPDINNVNLKSLVEKAIILSRSVPQETRVNNVYIKNRVAYVDLNDIFFDDGNTSSSAGSAMKIGSLTNLFCHNGFLEVDSVTFLRNGNIYTWFSQGIQNRNKKGFGVLD